MFNELFSEYFNSKPVIIGGLALLAIVYGYDVWAHHFLLFRNLTNDTLNNATNNAMSVIFSLYSFYYFYLLLKDYKPVSLKTSASFWWVAGVFCYYFGSTAVNLLRDKLQSPYFDFLPYMLLVSIWIIYGCWSYSFICRRWATTRSNS
ncbi:hypothetical protein [Mucilaginibacter xinganensis]|nr:hypothetical protein [Mucilaginibacter xinganensis]